MSLFQLSTERQQQCLKAAGVVLFLITPGSLLVLPLAAGWMAWRARRTSQNVNAQRPTNIGVRFSMNAVRPSS